jgi:hypothetical protein
MPATDFRPTQARTEMIKFVATYKGQARFEARLKLFAPISRKDQYGQKGPDL